MLLATGVVAQTGADKAQTNIRYVSKYGAYANNGETWATAKNNVQDAINSLVDAGLTGEVWVARGTYTPTESTEKSGGSTLYMSFKVPAGITVRGGFFGRAPLPESGTQGIDPETKEVLVEDSLALFRKVKGENYETEEINGKTWYVGEKKLSERATQQFTQTSSSGQTIEQDWTFVYPTTLSGNLSSKAKFVWNKAKQYWDASFYGNCYHVVWFATNGFDATTGRANPLDTSRGEAAVEGFTIENGNARNTDLTGRFHNAYGGGAYMVWGSRMENCRVVNCEASRDGGGVYMDGGGVMKHCYVANSQALGIGVQFGYGGGVCLDATGQPDRYGIYRSVIVGNVGRMGGGLAIKVETPANESKETIPAHYRAFASAVLVGNNTATTEGGGVYTHGGGAMTNMSVVNNRCNGSGITSGGMQTGRAGGMYCRDHALILNSVFWGNDCQANNDIQFAATKSSTEVANVDMQFCALEKSDYTDWSVTSKQSVFSISEYNDFDDFTAATKLTQASENDIFPNFIAPAPAAGYHDGLVEGILQQTCWIPGPNSGLANAGIVSLDLNIEGNLPFVAIPTDILDRQYNSRSTLGAYSRKFGNMKPVKAALCDLEGNPNGTKVEAWHFFVDPNASTGSNTVDHGIGWHDPARYLGNVLHTIDSLRYLADKNTPLVVDGVTYDLRPTFDANGKLTNPVFIHIKEGTMNTTNSYASGRVRNISLAVPGNVVILGGYPEQLTQTNLTETISATPYSRNPVRYPTYITGEIIAGEYAQNAARLLTLNTGVNNVIIDGLNLRYANARSAEQGNTIFDGGGISMRGVNNVKVRNTVISGCTAEKGAAVYVEDGKGVEFENCIFHNNEAATDGGSELGGVVYVGNTTTTTTTTFKHCNILNNVGYGISLTKNVYQYWYNSVAFANMNQNYLLEKKDKGDDEVYVATNATESEHTAFLRDYVAETFHVVDGGLLQNIRTYNCFHDAKRERIEGTHPDGTEIESEDDYNAHLLEYYLNKPGKYPRFINGIVNAGVSLGGDRTFYGRATSFEPHNDNPMVNSAISYVFNPDGTVQTDNNKPVENKNHETWGYDMSGITPRTYGGLPDVGAFENHTATTETGDENAYTGGQPAYGEVVYVKEDGNDSNSGMSWDEPLATVQAAIEKANGIVVEVGQKEQENIYISRTEEITDLDILTTTWFQVRNDTYTSCWWYINESDLLEGNNISSETTDKNTLFTLESAGTGYYIKTYSGKYLLAQNVANNGTTPITTVDKKEAATSFRVTYTNNVFRIYVSYNNRNYYLRGYSATAMRWTTSTSGTAGNSRSWSIYNTDLRKETIIVPDTRKAQVWVAEGTYTKRSDESDHALTGQRIHQQKFSIMLREGVNVYGGFSKDGYPGFEDRDPKKYETIVQPGNPLEDIDDETKTILKDRGITGEYPLEYRANSATCGSYGRVVVQETKFDIETVFDGFTITNGYLNSTARVVINAMLFKVMEESDNQVGLWGGGGVYLLENGVIENCLVKGNMTYANPEYTSTNSSTAEENNRTFMAINGDQGACHVVGAGVYNNGGIIKNCEIANNIILFELERRLGNTWSPGNYGTDSERHPDAAGLYGAGIFQEKGTVYNTIIHDNILKVTNMKGINDSQTEFTNGDNLQWGGSKIGYDNPYSELGKKHNEFWPTGDGFINRNTGVKDCNQYLAGAGVFLVAGDFYNNTVVNNKYRLWPTYRPGKTTIGIGGVYAFNGATIYNSIVANNEPAKFEDAGLSNPNNTETFITGSNDTYLNFPIICFDTEASTYTYNDGALTVQYSAVDYQSAVNVWNVDYPTPIRNQCFDQDNHDLQLFNSVNSWGYFDNTDMPKYDAVGEYSSSYGTNWYGKIDDTQILYEYYDEDDERYNKDTQYHLVTKSPAINKGTDEYEILNTVLPEVDADYTDRIKDCTVDMGAYEYNDAYEIKPDLRYKEGSTVEVDSAFYYVTPDGLGLASAENPANAACASKLQKVLDAAGRYKYQNRGVNVVVKVAYSKEWHDLSSGFKYYATRTTETDNPDVRQWSIIVPRGVEVWGGYSDDYKDEDNTGFYNIVDDKRADARDIIEYPTYFDSYYSNADNPNGVYNYHVVTFTEQVFDANGKPYKKGDVIGQSSTYTGMAAETLMSMSVDGGVTDRAVIDGIFITGGRADVKTFSSTSENVNVNSYGGAAIVTDYAHVRNCIVRGNEGVYGGALALTHGALVTGCLIEENTADYGGAIYVFAEGTKLSNGTTVNSENEQYDGSVQSNATRYDLNMPHVLSSTIVNNRANVQGGGVWFTDNVRFNSVAIWQNLCQDQANVRGEYNVTRPDNETYTTTEYYPFNYSAVQNVQPSGLNNVNLNLTNKYGARFYSEAYLKHKLDGAELQPRTPVLAMEKSDLPDSFERLADFSYFLPSDYSVLVHGGMPIAEYEEIVGKSIAPTDFLGRSRSETGSRRSFIEIGALASDKVFATKKLMLRLFVAQPDDIDPDAALAMNMAEQNNQGNGGTATGTEAEFNSYYSQEGSSFAYPFQKLQDALDYIYFQRGYTGNLNDPIDENYLNAANSETAHANNMSFEIFLGPGTYYPSVDLSGQNNYAVANTFLIPEGVSLVGGHAPEDACDWKGVTKENEYTGEGETKTLTAKHFLGAHSWANYIAPENRINPLTNNTYYSENAYYVDLNKQEISQKEFSVTGENGVTYTLHHVNKNIANARRKLADINANSVIEPWEFAKQTVLSGKVEGMENDGVNHIVTVIADERYTGALPHVQGAPEKMFETPTNDADKGYQPHEHGQIVSFDGLTFTGGYAYGYKPNSMDNNHKMKYNNGGAILVDGNRYQNSFNYPNDSERNTYKYQHGDKMATVGFREIPVMINRCKFEDNLAGFGGAIATNTTLDIVNTSFEHNRALAGEDLNVDYVPVNKTEPVYLNVRYPGVGGAIYATYQVTAMNTIFANNEAVAEGQEGLHDYTLLSDLIWSADNNNNNNTRELIAGSGGAVAMARKGQFHFLNCNFVRNAANAYPAIFTVNPNYDSQIAEAGTYVSTKTYNQAFNCVFWGNEITDEVKTWEGALGGKTKVTDADREEYLWAINKIVNYGPADRNGELYNIGVTDKDHAYDQTTLDDETKYTGTIWFSAYEAGKGRTPSNVVDLRDMPFTPRVHVRTQIKDELTKDEYNSYDVEYQNCNIVLDPANAVTEGPNFVNPSTKAGYEGYMESADWSPARINRLTDSGWGKIEQKINPTTGKPEFVTYATDAEVPSLPANRKDGERYSSEAAGSYKVEGAYTAIRYMRGLEKYQLTMPVGTQEYMYSSFLDSEDKPISFQRISYDPNPTHNQTYIDMGVYEYYHSQLTPDVEGDEVDVLWVSAVEKDDAIADGKTWRTPTSDLQRAIETLLSSRNGRRKEIRLLDGTFVPIYTIKGNLGFYIDTEYQNNTVVLPTSTDENNQTTTPTYGKGVQSLTIKGGYSSELEGERDVDEYPAIIRQQVRTDGGQSDRWNHLFLIADPTQRYGLSKYDEQENGNGHISDNNTGITTIPIEFDGVTLINDQAQPGTEGSVIHYAGLEGMLGAAKNNSKYTAITDGYEIKPALTNVTVQPENGVAGKHYWSQITPAKIILSKTKIYGSGKSTSIAASEEALDGEGVTPATAPSAVYLGDAQGGHAVLYNNVMHTNTVNPLVSGAKTLTVNNTFALNAGKVWLNGNGSTIHNSVLWMNNENKSADVTEDTKYGAQFYLAGFGASNEVSPKNFTGTLPTDITSVAEILSNNAYTNSAEYSELLTNSTDYSETGEVSQYAFNTALYSDNSNFMLGPNFTDPMNADISLRDFTLLPSMRLMNRGADANYSILKVAVTGDLPTLDDNQAGAAVTGTASGNLIDLAYEPTYNEDAVTNPRFMNTIDLGAYEYQKRMRRVIYVDPNNAITTTDEESGESWENPIGMKGLQDAIDLAALYHTNNTTEQAFVFVRGTTQLGLNPADQVHTGEAVTLRNGVSVYGGIRPSFVEGCDVTNTNGVITHGNGQIKAYLAKLEHDSEGYIGPNTHRTAITGINTNEYTAFNTGTDVPTEGNALRVQSFIKGFHVTPVDANSTVTAPVIDIDPRVSTGDTGTPKVALSHIAVYGNNAGNAEPIAKMKNSLVYASIFRDNTTQKDADGKDVAVLRLDEGAYAVSVSVQGATESKITDYVRYYNGTKKDGSVGEAQTRIINSLVNYDREDPEYTLSADLAGATGTAADTLVTAQTKYTFSGWNYRRNDRNMYFQLSEGSKHINEIELTDGDKLTSNMANMPDNLKAFIDYQNDRDILGNPRLLTLIENPNGKELLDRGAFETWKIEKDTWTTKDGHFAPHTGSVVYVAENRNLICGTEFHPGFLLLKDGASLYGNGQNVLVSFVAVEREIEPDGSVVSLPFETHYSKGKTFSDGVARSYYEDVSGTLSHNMDGILHLVYDENTPLKVYGYNAAARSDADYDFSPTSGAWTLLEGDATTKPANEGVLIVPHPDVVAKLGKEAPYIDGKLIYSFTAMGKTWYNNVYTEAPGEHFKEVVLTQNDDRTPDGGADFTSKDNMGWNLIGLPYLVSDYKTHEKGTGSYAAKEGVSESNVYNMDIPHELWLYYDGKTDADGNKIAPDGSADAVAAGGFYKVNSWDAAAADWHLAADDTEGPRIWWGEGIFTQTAAVSGQESLRFYRPVAPAEPIATEARTRGNKRYYVMEQQMEEETVVPIRITVNEHTVTITGLEGDERISFFDASGRIRLSDRADGSDFSTTIPEDGVYIIRVNNLRQKVLVK